MEIGDIFRMVGEGLYKKGSIENWDEYLSQSTLVGTPGAHKRHNIQTRIERFRDELKLRHENDQDLSIPYLSTEEIWNIIADICGPDANLNTIEGDLAWVDFDHFKRGIQTAAVVANQVASNRGTILIATGHHESMPPVYAYIRKVLIERGAKFHTPNVYPVPMNDGLVYMGSVCGVVLYIKDNNAMHHHMVDGMRTILEKEEVRPDLVIADHGCALAAIQENIPTIAIVDTNDIELLVKASIFKDRVFPIPFDDNAGMEQSMKMAYYFEYLLSNILVD